MTSVAFENAFHRLMAYEGGYSNDADDHGGETKWGVSKAAYPDEDIPNLTMQRAKDLFYRDIWQALRLDNLKDGAVAGEIFEQGANFGNGGAAKNVQNVLNLLGAELVVDGNLGPRTTAAINAFSDQRLLQRALNGEQYHRYREIVARDPTQKRFARGWLRRVEV